MFKKTLRWLGLTISIASLIVIIIGFIFYSIHIHEIYFHQSGIRWLAEGMVLGLILAAIGFWENE